MKKILITILCFCSTIISCNNSSGKQAVQQDIATVQTSTPSSNPPLNGYGTFSFTQDGKQRTFTCWHQFILFPMSDTTTILLLEDGGPSGAGFDFKINKTGATEFKEGYANILAPPLLFTFFDTTGISYIGDDMVVNVTSLSTNRLTGTFTGRFVKEKYQIKENNSPVIPQVIEITDGKFDLNTTKQSN